MSKTRLAAPAASGLPALLLALLIAAAPLAAGAADSGPPVAADPLAEVRAHLAANRWSAAIEELQRIDARDNADWNNLMGYSMRKRKTPDLAAAERYYDEALRLNPQHRGALEYSGELYLMKGELAKAEARLAALDKQCFLPCAEYTDLKNAVERYKATGRY